MGTRLGGLWVVNGTTTDSVEAMDQTRQWESAVSWGIDALLDQDAIRIKVPGLHLALASLTFEGDANVTYYAEIRVNGISVANGALITAQEVGTADKPYQLVAFGAGKLDEGDLVSVYVGSDEAGGADFKIVYGQFGVLSL